VRIPRFAGNAHYLHAIEDLEQEIPHLSASKWGGRSLVSKMKDKYPSELLGTRRWYAVHTKPCHEKRVAEHLQIRSVEMFLPVYRSARRWNNGCKVNLERALFPGYVFVCILRNERTRVLELSGVVSIVGTRHEPTPLPTEYVERLRSGLHLVNAQPHPGLAVGERVRICAGPLEGVSGTVARDKNGFRVVLTVDLIMKSVAVEVSVDDVEPIQQVPNASCRAMLFVAEN
jgi:transcription antitermination factor NusG